MTPKKEGWAGIGSPHWKDTELLFEKKHLIPALQQLVTSYSSNNICGEAISQVDKHKRLRLYLTKWRYDSAAMPETS
jgi:hypothetical protein